MYEQFVNLLVDELQIDKDEITMDAELSGDLGINSIELADLVMLCEDRFSITIDDDDLRWGLTYIFYLTMQTSSLYSRLRPEEKKERKQGAKISPLFLLQMLPNQFTTAEAEKIGKELGISPRTTSKHLNTLVSNDSLKRPYNGLYVKVGKKNKKTKPAA